MQSVDLDVSPLYRVLHDFYVDWYIMTFKMMITRREAICPQMFIKILFQTLMLFEKMQ